jgi:hypothetical protein
LDIGKRERRIKDKKRDTGNSKRMEEKYDRKLIAK